MTEQQRQPRKSAKRKEGRVKNEEGGGKRNKVKEKKKTGEKGKKAKNIEGNGREKNKGYHEKERGDCNRYKRIQAQRTRE